MLKDLNKIINTRRRKTKDMKRTGQILEVRNDTVCLEAPGWFHGGHGRRKERSVASRRAPRVGGGGWRVTLRAHWGLRVWLHSGA